MTAAAPPARRVLPTLARRDHPLASPRRQRELLAAVPSARAFDEAAAGAGHAPLAARGVEVLQMNLGKRCNQTCRHCHVDAGPDRTEVMGDAVLDACLALLEAGAVPAVDVTGGAPELHPRFRELVERASARGLRVIDRCNLTITRLPNYADLPEFFARHRVEVVASLPWYAESRTDAQRGGGVFEASLAALRRLNELGYGRDGSGLVLHLVTNPAGAYLPAGQAALERDWKREMLRRHGVHFNRLYALTNMPVSRYLEFLAEGELLEAYMTKLVGAFNPATVEGLMCRTTLSVGWDGRLYDCDFNQMLELPLGRTIFDVDLDELGQRSVRTGPHCFGCTAGAGSSCGGALAAGEGGPARP
ncbi:MAG TPA: arsenosugar biosynthesis radical SAM (seleno)protein ArsS [Polyangiaceae bacterium]|nr:arsenosugar biosynthesis radical SAM (seleno)protein ArsS [Polyangiaceae bacterium]